jgi:hypothetical protein
MGVFLIPKRVAAAVLLSVLLGGCSLQTGIEDLLSPPRLTTEQSMLYDALERAVGTDTFKLRYPRRGSYLSACIFWDINHDGENEAIAFYELTVGGTTSTWMSVLTKDGGGMWRSAMEIPGEGSEIDLVSFARSPTQRLTTLLWAGRSPGRKIRPARCTRLKTARSRRFFPMITVSFSSTTLMKTAWTKIFYVQSAHRGRP